MLDHLLSKHANQSLSLSDICHDEEFVLICESGRSPSARRKNAQRDIRQRRPNAPRACNEGDNIAGVRIATIVRLRTRMSKTTLDCVAVAGRFRIDVREFARYSQSHRHQLGRPTYIGALNSVSNDLEAVKIPNLAAGTYSWTVIATLLLLLVPLCARGMYPFQNLAIKRATVVENFPEVAVPSSAFMRMAVVGGIALALYRGLFPVVLSFLRTCI